MNASGPDCETHREDNYLWSHLVSVSLNKVFTFSMSHSSALCGWLWLCDLLSKFKENNIPQISTRWNWLKKAKSQRGLLWAYLKVCAYVCACVCEWVNEENAKSKKKWGHSRLAWSEVRWMAGAAPESCFSHTLSPSVFTAIHLPCPGASPCPMPAQGLLTKAMDTGSCSSTTQKKNASSSHWGHFVSFYTRGVDRESEGFR